MSAIERLFKGCIDTHFHASPDPRVERSVDALRCAGQCADAGMRGLVLKSHDYPTAPIAYVLNQTVKNIEVFGSLTLNYDVGGLNTHAVEASVKMGAKVIWMPTLDSVDHTQRKRHEKGGIYILDSAGKILPEVKKILEIIKSYKVVLATGHLTKPEVFTLVAEGRNMGLDKIVVTHPLTDVGPCLTVDEIARISGEGIYIEHTMIMTNPILGDVKVPTIVESIRRTGAERCILSTDFGQPFSPTCAEGMRMWIATMLEFGVSEKDIEIMVKTNPAKILGLD